MRVHSPFTEPVRRARTLNSVPARHPLLAAIEPVAEAMGATIVERSKVRPGDIPLTWEGELVGGFRPAQPQDGLDALIAAVESEMGAALVELTREDKQTAVARLNELGAFRYRKAVEDIADALGVSRFTVYNYLNARG